MKSEETQLEIAILHQNMIAVRHFGSCTVHYLAS